MNIKMLTIVNIQKIFQHFSTSSETQKYLDWSIGQTGKNNLRKPEIQKTTFIKDKNLTKPNIQKILHKTTVQKCTQETTIVDYKKVILLAKVSIQQKLRIPKSGIVNDLGII